MMFVFIILLLCCFYIFLVCPRLKKASNRMFSNRFFSHRGLHDGNKTISENSIPAFKLSCDKNYGIELDVQLTKDKKVVVFHDDDLKRMCSIDGTIQDLTFEELSLYPLLGSNDTIPLFSEVLKTIDGLVPLIIELKIHGVAKELCIAVDECLKDYTGYYCVESFHPCALRWYKKNRPGVLRGQLSSNIEKDMNKKKFSYWCAYNLFFNFLSRPDFIAFSCIYRRAFGFVFVTRLLKAYSVLWTLESQKDFESYTVHYNAFIFESFEPKREI